MIYLNIKGHDRVHFFKSLLCIQVTVCCLGLRKSEFYLTSHTSSRCLFVEFLSSNITMLGMISNLVKLHTFRIKMHVPLNCRAPIELTFLDYLPSLWTDLPKVWSARNPGVSPRFFNAYLFQDFQKLER